MDWKPILKNAGSLAGVILAGSILVRVGFAFGKDTGYVEGRMEEDQALQDAEYRCGLRVDKAFGDAHRGDEIFYGEKLHELQLQLDYCHADNCKAVLSCKLPNPSH